jgi:hypothetical protein
MMACVHADQEHQDEEEYAEDAFDRRVNTVLQHDAALLRDRSAMLLATGTISIERPTGVVAAQLGRPVLRWRRARLDIHAAPADSSRSASAHGLTAARYRDRAALLREIELTVAVHIAWLEEDE